MKQWGMVLLLVVACVLVYGRTLYFDYTYYDDQALIIDNKEFLGNLSHIPAAFSLHVFASQGTASLYYRPLLTVSLIVDTVLGGGSAQAYHLTNLIVHISSVLLFFWLTQLLSYRRDLSFIAAAIFAVHPVLAQAVAWLPGRNDALLGGIFLGSLIAFLRKSRWWHSGLFALALFTKETAVMIPIVIGLHAFFYQPKKWKKVVRSWLPAWIVPLVIWSYMRHTALTAPGSVTFLSRMAGGIAALPALFVYLGKVFWPINLAVLPVLPDSPLTPGVVASAGVLLVIVCTMHYRRSRRVLWPFMWFLLMLLPSLIPSEPAEQPIFLEHRLYIPLMGLLILLLAASEALKMGAERLVKVVGAVLIVALCLLTYRHVAVFANRSIFWNAAVLASPHSAAAHHNRGGMLQSNQDYSGAEREYLAALALDPQITLTHHNLAMVYLAEGKLPEAEVHAVAELNRRPFAAAFAQLGKIYMVGGRYEEALRAFLSAVSLDPYHPEANVALAKYYSISGDFVRAKQYYRVAHQYGLELDFSAPDGAGTQ